MARRHPVQRDAVGILAGHDGGDRGRVGDAARQRLGRHRGAHDGRADLVPLAMAAAVLEADMLPYPRLGRRDMQLFGHVFADAVHRLLAAGTDLLVFRQVVFNALARQIGRQWPASARLICNKIHRRRAAAIAGSASARVPKMSHRVAAHGVDIDAVEQPVQLLGGQFHDRLFPARPGEAILLQALDP
jgi:hypothetical protein